MDDEDPSRSHRMSVEASPAPSETRAARAPRLWPAVVMVGLFWAVYTAAYQIDLTTGVRFFTRLGAAVLLALGSLVWWWCRRRVGWADKLFGFAAVVGPGAAA